MTESSDSAAIVLTDVYKSFDGVKAVNGISFRVETGQTVALLGGNGAGKTTTISMLLGLLSPTTGEVRVLGAKMPEDRHNVLGLMNFSSPYVDLPKRLKVWENLTVYAHLYGVRDVKGRIKELADDLELDRFLKRPFGDLSAGQKTRVALAKSLLNAPHLLLMDEPTASLDPDTGDWVRSYLERYRARTGATILLASHNMGVSLPFIEEMWSRNLAQLFVSPLRDVELIFALILMSLVRTLISVTPAAFLALPFFDVWVFQLGVPLLAFFANLLIFGAVIGIAVSALILRFGLGAESLCWLGIFLLAPVSAIYYPVSALPGWLQAIALMLPSAHTFEGMRGVLFDGVFLWSHFWWAAGLNAVLLVAATLFFLHMMKKARIKGLLMQQGE